MEKNKQYLTKENIVFFAYEILNLSSGVFAFLKGDDIDQKKKPNVTDLLEKGIRLTDEFKAGLLKYMDKLEIEMAQSNKKDVSGGGNSS